MDTLTALGDWAWVMVPVAAGLAAFTHTLRLRTAASLEAAAPPPVVPRLVGDGHFTVQVSDATQHQATLARLVARDARLDREAALVPEPGRRDEGGRIRVEIDGLVVGHLDPEAARHWQRQRRLRGIALPTARVDARIEATDACSPGGPAAWTVRLSLPDATT